jgi:hypothetical protein
MLGFQKSLDFTTMNSGLWTRVYHTAWPSGEAGLRRLAVLVLPLDLPLSFMVLGNLLNLSVLQTQ